MESITKSRLTAETIRRMTQKAFGETEPPFVKELTEGYFNAAYLVRLPDGREAILKVAPPPGTLLMTYEKDIMSAEVASMRLVKEKTHAPVPEVLFYDNSRTICASDYFLMQKLDGQSLSQISDMLTAECREKIEFDAGRFNAEINQITGSRFGYFSQPERQGADWYTVFRGMMDDALRDAAALKIDVGADPDMIRDLLAKEEPCFAEVTVPRLVHWDLWAGNIFVKDGAITGLIDFERCLWADTLMEVGFRSDRQNPAFLKGYGAGKLTGSQQARVRWYDLYLFLTNALETDYRKYPDRRMLEWARGKVKETLNRLERDRTV